MKVSAENYLSLALADNRIIRPEYPEITAWSLHGGKRLN